MEEHYLRINRVILIKKPTEKLHLSKFVYLFVLPTFTYVNRNATLQITSKVSRDANIVITIKYS